MDKNYPNSTPSDDWKTTYRQNYASVFTVPEQVARARRLDAFESIPLLSEVLSDSPKHTEIIRLLPTYNSKTSNWLYDGAAIVLIEPYHAPISDYAVDGLSIIEVPEEIAPYCGYFGDGPCDRPKTRSYMVCREVNKKKIRKLHSQLLDRAIKMPRWNTIEGE